MKYSLLLLFSFITYNFVIYSQVDSVASVDHSKITLSTDIVPQWKVQMEVGGSCWYSYDYYFLPGTIHENKVTNYNMKLRVPALAFRIGIVKNIELRLGFVFAQEFTGNFKANKFYLREVRNGVYSVAPIEAGIKVKLLDESKMIPSAAIKADVFIPAGNFYFHMDYVSPVFRLMLQKNISKNFGVGVNAGYGWNVYDSFTEKYGSYSLSLNANISRKIGAYAESFSYFQNGSIPDHRIGAGLTYHFAKNVMAVVQGGFGISERAPDMFGSGGIGFMFP